MANPYQIAYQQSIHDPDSFWSEAAQDCHWYKKWERVLDDSNAPFFRWFPGGEMNTCYNALDIHIDNGRGDQDALIYDSPVTDTIKKFTYRQLRDEVAQFAGVLASRGVQKGDRVIIYMPMIPEAAIAMLACARLGAVHSVVFGGFAANELATRINDARPKVIVSASCGIEVKRIVRYKPLLDGAIEMAETLTGTKPCQRQSHMTAFLSNLQILCIFFTHQERPDNQRVLCVTTAGTWLP
jgi:propionyl-CoA synthetase